MNSPNNILLAFEPVLQNDGTPEGFVVSLLNDCPDPILFELDFFAGGVKRFGKKGKLDAGGYSELGKMQYDDLNEFPEAKVTCWKIVKDGTSSRYAKDMRIKPGVFFSSLTPVAPILHRQAHVLTLFEGLSAERKKNHAEDLKAYTQRKAPPVRQWHESANDDRSQHEVREAADFSIELDLHIEKLVQGHEQLSNAQILQLQVRVFEAYIEKAIRLGMERVFIIHGVGEGRLRNTIASSLFRIPEVITFKNEYHPKYGYGATEVILIM
jgi:DNA-nicking Smr family endonuclease